MDSILVLLSTPALYYVLIGVIIGWLGGMEYGWRQHVDYVRRTEMTRAEAKAARERDRRRVEQ